jgi:HK97 family phage major capsid protein
MEDIKKIVDEVKSDINEMITKGVGREMEGLGLEDLISNTKNAGTKLASLEEKLGFVEKSMTDFILDAKNNAPAKKENLMAKAFEANADKFKALGQRRDASFGFNMELKAVGDMNLTANIGAGWASSIAGLSNTILTDPFRQIRLRDILRNSTIEQNGVFKYAKKTSGEGGPAIQTEGSSKAQVDYDFTITEVTPKTIATYAKISKQMLQRLTWLQSFVSTQMVNDLLDVEDTNLYDYAGTSAFAGLYENASTYTPSGTVTITSNRWDKLANSYAQLKANKFAPTAILVNPIDEMELMINKESGAGYSNPALLNGGRLSIAGVPVISTDIVTANTFMIGDFNKAAELLFEDNIMTEFAYEDGDNFTKNLVTVRVEESIAMPIYFANAMKKGSFATA